jgi:hypothetical protein
MTLIANEIHRFLSWAQLCEQDYLLGYYPKYCKHPIAAEWEDNDYPFWDDLSNAFYTTIDRGSSLTQPEIHAASIACIIDFESGHFFDAIIDHGDRLRSRSLVTRILTLPGTKGLDVALPSLRKYPELIDPNILVDIITARCTRFGHIKDAFTLLAMLNKDLTKSTAIRLAMHPNSLYNAFAIYTLGAIDPMVSLECLSYYSQDYRKQIEDLTEALNGPSRPPRA